MNAPTIEQIKKLTDGECLITTDLHESANEIWKIHDMYFVFEIPEFGGDAAYFDMYHETRLNTMISAIDNLT